MPGFQFQFGNQIQVESSRHKRFRHILFADRQREVAERRIEAGGVDNIDSGELRLVVDSGDRDTTIAETCTQWAIQILNSKLAIELIGLQFEDVNSASDQFDLIAFAVGVFVVEIERVVLMQLRANLKHAVL